MVDGELVSTIALYTALTGAVGFLAKIALDYLEDLKLARNEWRAQAKESAANLRDLTEAILQVAPDLRTRLLDAAEDEGTRRRGGRVE